MTKLAFLICAAVTVVSVRDGDAYSAATFAVLVGMFLERLRS